MKRVLIIAYYWPPSGGSGVQRWLNFTKYFSEFGWQAVVYTPENPDFDIQDETLLEEVHPKVEVLKLPIWEPYRIHHALFKKKKSNNKAGVVDTGKSGFWSNWIRGNVFIPDPKIFWRKPSVRFLSNYLAKNPVDAIISTGTPHSMHLIALSLKKHFSTIPWIADFRDPWTELDMLKSYHIHPICMKKYRALEKSVLKTADLCMTTSRVWANDFERLGAKKCISITNGFDEKDFKVDVEPYSMFVLSHFGLLNHLRNPSILWQALNSLCEENDGFKKEFRLHLGGTIAQENLDEIQSYPHLREAMKVFPYLSHKEVVSEYLKSSVLLLLLFNSDSGKGNIPGKLFEYLASRRKILAFGPDRGDSAEIIETNQAGLFIRYQEQEIDRIKEFMLHSFNEFQKENIQLKVTGIEKYSRRNTTATLVKEIEKLL